MLNCYSFSSLLSTIARLNYQLPSARDSCFMDDKVEWLVWHWLLFFWGVPASHGVVSWASVNRSLHRSISCALKAKRKAKPRRLTFRVPRVKKIQKRAVETDLVNIWKTDERTGAFCVETWPRADSGSPFKLFDRTERALLLEVTVWTWGCAPLVCYSAPTW